MFWLKNIRIISNFCFEFRLTDLQEWALISEFKHLLR